MQIAILGTGRMARGIGYALRGTTHDLTFGSRDPAAAELLARAMQDEHARRYHGASHAAAIARADVVFLAVPFGAVLETLAPLADLLDGRVVVDLSNPLNPAYDGLVVAPGESASELIAAQLGPRARVVAALKNTFANTFAEPSIGGGPAPDVLIAGEDTEAKNLVAGLVREMGFGAIDAGPLKEARTLEAMTVLLLRLSSQHHWNGMAGWKVLH